MRKENVDIHSKYNLLSLASGIGGLDLALRLALDGNTRSVCYVEREAFAISTLVKCIEEKVMDDAPIWTDVRTFDGTAWHGLVDGIIGGYPCQPYSNAGKKLGKADERNLTEHVIRIVREAQPYFCFFENVGAHLRIGFREVKSELESLHYRVEAGLFSASEIGATHKRERLFILAAKEGWRLADAKRLRPRGGNLPFGNGGRADGDTWDAAQTETARPGRELDDRNGKGLERYGTDRERANERTAWSPGSPLEYAHEIRLEGRKSIPKRNGEYPFLSDECVSFPIFPPSPSDQAAWSEVLQAHPEVEPALCGMADEFSDALDGLAFREERLRALGNGVVPLAGAFAFRVLWKRLEQNLDSIT